MDDIENLKTDANIANILQKLKSTSSKPKPVSADEIPEPEKDTAVNTNAAELATAAPETYSVNDEVQDIPQSVMDRKNDVAVPEKLESEHLTDESILPWLSRSDKDLRLIHYITSDEKGSLVYNTVKTDRPATDLASLKLKPNYLCDIDYYISKHYVLCVKQFESNLQNSRAYSVDNDSNSVMESANNDFVKTSSDDIANRVAVTEKYYQYVVFTDFGIADFIVNAESLPYPFCESDLNKWFEEASNYTQMLNTHYSVNPHVLHSDIREYRYDIITMRRPGVITLDSVDNEDPNYQLHLKLKDKYNFIPINRILECLKAYSNSNDKSFDDFRRFVTRYFDVAV